jgi:hypothetical protein
MAKKNQKTVVQEMEVKTENAVPPTLQNLTSTEMLARIRANVKERKRLATENKELYALYKGAKSLEKAASTEARIKALTAQLEALKNPGQKVTK